MTEQDKVTVDDIIGIVKTEEQTDSVEEVRKLRGRENKTAKRFTIKPSMIVDDVTVIIDNQKEYTFPVLDSTLNYMFCKALNEQHEENKELKEENEYLCEKIKENEWHWNTIDEDRDVWKYKCKTLEEENKELKCENKNLKSILNDFINILNRLQSNPTDEQTLAVARDMLQNMGKELLE